MFISSFPVEMECEIYSRANVQCLQVGYPLQHAQEFWELCSGNGPRRERRPSGSLPHFCGQSRKIHKFVDSLINFPFFDSFLCFTFLGCLVSFNISLTVSSRAVLTYIWCCQGGDLAELSKHAHSNTVDRYSVQLLLRNIFKPCACAVLNKLQDQVMHNTCMKYDVK